MDHDFENSREESGGPEGALPKGYRLTEQLQAAPSSFKVHLAIPLQWGHRPLGECAPGAPGSRVGLPLAARCTGIPWAAARWAFP
eukprot:205532-Alexandrium_andersonii.AAC.1